MTIYARLPQLRRALSLPAQAGEDERLLDVAEQMSRAVDAHLGYEVAPVIATRWVRNPTTASIRRLRDRVYLPQPMAAVSAVTVQQVEGDPASEVTLMVGADVYADPGGGGAIWMLGLAPGAPVSSWPVHGQLQVSGIWGLPWSAEPTGLTATAGVAGDITCSASAEGLVYPGDLIAVGGEWCEVAAVSGAIVTAARGVRGTAASAHSGAAVAVLAPPPVITRALLAWVSRMAWDESGGWQGSVVLTEAGMGVGSARSATPWAAVAGLLAPYRRVAFA